MLPGIYFSSKPCPLKRKSLKCAVYRRILLLFTCNCTVYPDKKANLTHTIYVQNRTQVGLKAFVTDVVEKASSNRWHKVSATWTHVGLLISHQVLRIVPLASWLAQSLHFWTHFIRTYCHLIKGLIFPVDLFSCFLCNFLQMSGMWNFCTYHEIEDGRVFQILVYNDKTASMRKEFFYSIDKTTWSEHYGHLSSN